jgi:polysaccharide deacetylase family protein (PEP-CTERM system associated)
VGVIGEESRPGAVVVSFDVEEHHRIEAAAGLTFTDDQKRGYAARMEATTRRLLDQLAAAGARATFFLVGEIARDNPKLVADLAAAGHEVASHGWDHRRVHHFTPATFLADVLRCKDALEQASGQAVAGYRAPTFSVMRETAWAIDVLAEAGYRYDSSVFPVRHDRYGVPAAPRTPFLIEGRARTLLELPPATYRLLGQNLPVAGGGYFRLFPLSVLAAGVQQLAKRDPAVGMLYFHPWEFDPEQPRLPLKTLSRFRTYVGVGRSTARLGRLLERYKGRVRRAIDVVEELDPRRATLPRFSFTPAPTSAARPSASPSPGSGR